jgi:hypothetical protein
MARCSYCLKPAIAEIPANPERVCVTHAIEFWTGFLAFARANRLEATASPKDSCSGATAWSDETTREGRGAPASEPPLRTDWQGRVGADPPRAADDGLDRPAASSLTRPPAGAEDRVPHRVRA